MLDRSWAAGLTQAEFEREFLIRNPGGDVIPDVSLWPYAKELVYRTIDAPNPENMETEQKVKSVKKYPCRGCGQVFDYAIARAGHERGCKVALSSKKELTDV
jgi:hypothetical protein